MKWILRMLRSHAAVFKDHYYPFIPCTEWKWVQLLFTLLFFRTLWQTQCKHEKWRWIFTPISTVLQSLPIYGQSQTVYTFTSHFLHKQPSISCKIVSRCSSGGLPWLPYCWCDQAHWPHPGNLWPRVESAASVFGKETWPLKFWQLAVLRYKAHRGVPRLSRPLKVLKYNNPHLVSTSLEWRFKTGYRACQPEQSTFI